MCKPTNNDLSSQKVVCLDEIENADLNSYRNEYHFRTPVVVDKLATLLKDPRDEPMICLLVNIAEMITFGIILIFSVCTSSLPLYQKNLICLVYYVSFLLLFQERFTLCIHFASHRSIFHNELLNLSIGWVFAPFFGIPCGLYKLHHVVMHHIENNHELDMSSTEDYQRDSLLEFGRYWFHFVIGIWVELPSYTLRTKKYQWLSSCITGLGLYLTVIFLLAKYANFLGTIWLLVVPHIVAMTAMAFGNFSQHIFVNPEDRHSNYALTYNCINTPGNKTTFNDGYHVIHHINARLHWSEIPETFYKMKDKHIAGGSLTFREVMFMDVGILVMTGQLQKLASYYVHLGSKETAPTIGEVEKKLRSWLARCPRNEPAEEKKGK
mmetsp:Transcript_68209/g.142543  ORF Transcript_68209/g.142543 Transcript_68209/m.142543 type:complete len:380 (+) Transcript_68209:151-1290(+)